MCPSRDSALARAFLLGGISYLLFLLGLCLLLESGPSPATAARFCFHFLLVSGVTGLFVHRRPVRTRRIGAVLIAVGLAYLVVIHELKLVLR